MEIWSQIVMFVFFVSGTFCVLQPRSVVLNAKLLQGASVFLDL